MKVNKNLFALLCGTLLFIFSSLTAAATFVVDKTGAGNFTSIQAAVDHIASIESTGSNRGSAYFEYGSDMVYIEGGLSGLQAGMLISLDSRNWYEIARIVDAEYLQITRTFVEPTRFNRYKAVDVNIIKIKPGIYEENINLQNIHFIKFLGWKELNRELVIIQPPTPSEGAENLPASFKNIQLYGSIIFQNLTIRNTGDWTGNQSIIFSDPTSVSDMNLTLKNVFFDSSYCDLIYSYFGHVLIENSRLEGENDVLVGYFKSLTVKRSEIMSIRGIGPHSIGANAAASVEVSFNSLIEDSLIITKARDFANQSNPGSYGTALRIGTLNSGTTLTIRNSVIFVDGGTGGKALDLSNGAVNVVIEGSKLIARTNIPGAAVDLYMGGNANVTLKCTEYATVAGGGTPTVLTCP